MSASDRTALGPARDEVTRERDRLADEIGAFESLLASVDDLPPDHSADAPSSADAGVSPDGPGSGSANLLVSESDDAFAAFRDAYRETVLALDHWESSYDEATVAESVRGEFSDDLAAVLLDPSGTAFTPLIRDRVRTEIERSVRDRTESYRVVDREAATLEALSRDLDAVLADVRPVVDGTGTFEQRRARLDAALSTLDDLARSHQQYLHDRGDEADDLLTGMVYADLDTDYPGLSAIAAVRRALDRLRLHFWAGLC